MAGLQGRVLGGFQLSELIGSGGIAEVYRGRSTNAGAREVAIKIIYPEFARQPGFLPNFRRIVEMSGKLSNHPHILPVLASGEDNGYLYLVTPYVSGGTLRDWLLHGGRLGASDVAPFFRQLCGAVAYGHSLGIIHGNLKPSNIFLFEGRHILLGDFGMLWDIRQMDMNHVGSGTEAVEYLAPEAFQGQITQAGDLYSLGAVLFATLIGHPPFSGLKPADIFAAHTQQPVPHLSQVDGALAPQIAALDPIIQRAMAKRPDDRFAAATQIAQAIETTLQQMQSGPLALPVPANSPAVQQAWSLGMGTGMLGGPAEPGYPGYAGGNGPVVPPLGAMFGPMDQPFPPLGPSEQADAQMEAGRPDFGLGGQSAVSAESTVRMPAPRTIGEASERTAGASGIFTMQVPAPGAPWQDANGGNNGNNGSGGNGWAPGQGGWPPAPPYPSIAPDPSGGQWPDMVVDEAQVAQRMPAIQVGSAQPLPGDWPALDSPLGNGQFDPANGSHAPSRYGASGPRGQDAPFSPTELGLPRLTMPELPDMDPNWNQPRGDQYGGQSSYYGDGYSSEYQAAPGAGYEESRAYPSAAAAPSAPYADSRAYPATPGAPYDESRAYPATGQWATGDSFSHSAVYPFYDQAGGQRYNEGHPYDSREMMSFTAQRVWTNGGTARRARRRRRVRNLVMSVVVLLALLGGVFTAYARPDICPISICQSFSALAHRYVPSIGGVGAAEAQPLTASPASAKIAVVVGESATAKVTLTNPNAQAQAWTATTDLSWLLIGPNADTLAPNSSAALTLTAKPVGVNPGTYSANLAIAMSGATTHVPISIVVSAGARLTVSPSSLTFATCATQQTLTIKNTGDAALTYTATPSVSTALSLVVPQQPLAPGASAAIAATLSCQAVQGQSYAIILTSNGGSMQVPVQYGS